MQITRRDFILSLGFPALALLAPVSYLWKITAFASDFLSRRFPRVRVRENIFMAFNNIKDPENGESDEFTTMRNIQNILHDMDVVDGTIVIGIGARTGSPSLPYASPGEMGYLWKKGDKWDGKVTSHIDASPVPLLLDDPIVVTQVGVMHERTAHHFEINDPSLEGSVLWSLYKDETGSQTFNVGMHNVFSDVDGGMLEEIYETSQKAIKNPNTWATQRVRSRLTKFIPNLANETNWNNFSKTLAAPFVHSRWAQYVKDRGWPGAAVVLKGSFQNVGQFHLLEWVRKSPAEPEFEIGKGTHTALKIRSGREARPFMTHADGTWTMVGFIYNLDNTESTPSMETYKNFADIFGQDFHIHGFKDDGSVGGHTLFAQLGKGKLSVSLYPISFEQEETGFLFNNDLTILPATITQSADQLSVSVKNNGVNFVRNVSVQLSKIGIFGGHDNEDIKVIPMLKPDETFKLTFTGRAARATGKRCLWIDRNGHFMEGGVNGESNNKAYF